jgi:hypothetical protein
LLVADRQSEKWPGLGNKSSMRALGSTKAETAGVRSRELPAAAIAGWQFVVAAIFGLAQSIWIIRSFNGMSSQEALVTTAGLRTLDGHGLDDRYLESLPSSLLWPVISGLGYRLAGDSGSRLLSLALVAATFLALFAASRRLFGERAAAGSAVIMALAAPFLALGHLAVAESLAIAAISVSLWATIRLIDDEHRLWIVLASLALIVAALAQYRAGLAILPLTLIIAFRRGNRSPLDLLCLWGVFTLAAIIYFDAFSDQVADVVSWKMIGNPYPVEAHAASTAGAVMVIALWGFLPAMAGFLAARNVGERRVIATILAGTGAAWSALLLLSADTSQSLLFPDLAIGLVFGVPVLGSLLALPGDRFARSVVTAIVLVSVLTLGALQVSAFDRSWVDYGTINDQLVDDSTPETQVLANERWPIALSLYDAGVIDEPGDVVDGEMLFVSDVIFDLCAFTWMVDEPAFHPWDAFVTEAFSSCGAVAEIAKASQERAVLEVGIFPDELTSDVRLLRNESLFTGEAS